MLTFGQSLGFLETGQDRLGMIKIQKAASYYAATVSLSLCRFSLSKLRV